MKIKTSELKGRGLDWAVAIVDGFDVHYLECRPDAIPEYSENWEDCGELINKFEIWFSSDEVKCIASAPPHVNVAIQAGETPQIAICRAVVAMEFGDEIDISDMPGEIDG